jgi:hypothetical protein
MRGSQEMFTQERIKQQRIGQEVTQTGWTVYADLLLFIAKD